MNQDEFDEMIEELARFRTSDYVWMLVAGIAMGWLLVAGIVYQIKGGL